MGDLGGSSIDIVPMAFVPVKPFPVGLGEKCVSDIHGTIRSNSSDHQLLGIQGVSFSYWLPKGPIYAVP